MRFKNYLINEMAVGWSKASIEKFGTTIGASPAGEGFFTACVAHMGGKVGDPERFCANLKDTFRGTTTWRGKKK